MEQLKEFIKAQEKIYEIVSRTGASDYANGALDALWAIKNFIEVNE